MLWILIVRVILSRRFFRSQKCVYLDTFKMITDSNPDLFGYPSSIIVDTLRDE